MKTEITELLRKSFDDSGTFVRRQGKLRHRRYLLEHVEGGSGDRGNGLGMRRLLGVRAAREAMDEVVRRPRTGELHVTLPHGSAGGGEFVVIALDTFAVDEMCNVENHLTVFHQAAGYLFVEGQKETVHLEADRARAGLAFAGTSGVFTQAAEVLAADAVAGEMAVHFTDDAVVNKDLQVHFGFAAQFLDVGKELALVRANGLSQVFVVIEDRAEAEGQNRAMLETVGDDPGVVDTCLLIQCLLGIMLADYYSKIAGGIEENLVAAYP